MSRNPRSVVDPSLTLRLDLWLEPGIWQALTAWIPNPMRLSRTARSSVIPEHRARVASYGPSSSATTEAETFGFV